MAQLDNNRRSHSKGRGRHEKKAPLSGRTPQTHTNRPSHKRHSVQPAVRRYPSQPAQGRVRENDFRQQNRVRLQYGQNAQTEQSVNPQKRAAHYSPQISHFSRQNYGSTGRMTSNSALVKKRRMRTWKKVLLIILVAVIALFSIGAAFAFWYTTALESNMRGDGKTIGDLNGILDKVPYSEGTYTLVLASDSRTGTAYSNSAGYEDGTGRSDVIMLVRTDPVTNTITLVSIPRDTPFEIDGNKAKINEAFRLGGSAAEVNAVESITGVNVSHYVQIDFAGLERFIDTLGGIVVDVPIDIQGTDALTGETIILSAGSNQRLNGAEALVLARSRENYDTAQDERRQFGVREMTTSIIKEITSKSPMELPGLVDELSTCITTDVSTVDMITLASAFAGSNPTIYSCTGPSEGDEDPHTGLWLCYENPEGWHNLMTAVEAGQDPSGIDTSSTAIIP